MRLDIRENMMAIDVHLTPEWERFVREGVEGGRYNDVSDVVCSALRLLQEAEGRRLPFQNMLQAAEIEADREGTLAVDKVMAELDNVVRAQEE